MKRLIVLIILIMTSSFIFSQEPKKVKTYYDLEKTQLKEVYYTIKDTIKHGDYVSYYKIQQTKWEEGAYNNGKLNGNFKRWDTEGRLDVELNYVDDLLEGEQVRYIYTYEGRITRKFVRIHRYTFINGITMKLEVWMNDELFEVTTYNLYGKQTSYKKVSTKHETYYIWGN